MTVAIATSVYEAARHYIGPWIEGVRTLQRDSSPLDILVINDGFAALHAALASLDDIGSLTIIEADADSSIAQIRRKLLERAAKLSVEYIVFSDCDDVLRPNALTLFRHALKNADFAYGDVQLIDKNGADIAPSMFRGHDIPATIDSIDAILDRNFLGFTNTAINREALHNFTWPVELETKAVDWSLFSSLIIEGRRGRQTSDAVANYRIYTENVLGVSAPATLTGFIRAAEIAAQHFANFPAHRGMTERAHMMLRAREHALNDPTAFNNVTHRHRNKVGPWHQQTMLIARDLVKSTAA